MNPDVMRMANWGPERMIITPKGERIVRNALATPTIESYWANSPETLRKMGVMVKVWNNRIWATWARFPTPGEVQGFLEMEKLSSSASLEGEEFDCPCPIGKEYLPFQLAGVRYMTMKKGVILGDEMGLGKTIQIIGLINKLEDIKKALIVCPAGLKANWANELRNWLTRELRVRVMPSSDRRLPDGDIIVLNYDILWKIRMELRSVHWDLIACDEAHYIKNKDANRSKAILGWSEDKGKIVVPPVHAERKVLATGTPMPNRTKELWGLLNYVDPDTWKNEEYHLFAKRHCAGIVASNGKIISDHGNSNSEELNRKMRRSCMIRREKSQVLKDLPPKTRQTIWITSETAVDFWSGEEELKTKKMREIRDQLETQCARFEAAKAESFETYMHVYRQMESTSGTAFNLMAKMRKKIAMAKLDPCIKVLEEAIREGVKFLVFAHHIEAQQELHSRLPHSLLIPGGMDASEKQKLVEKFQKDDKVRCAVLSLMGSSVGLTLTAASTVFMFEWDWGPGINLQAEDRAHRIGQSDNVLCRYMVLEGSLDEHMIGIILDKQDAIDRTLNKDSKSGEVIDYDIEKMFELENQKLLKESKKIPLQERSGLREMVDKINRSGRMKSGYERTLAKLLLQAKWNDAHYVIAKKFIHRHHSNTV